MTPLTDDVLLAKIDGLAAMVAEFRGDFREMKSEFRDHVRQESETYRELGRIVGKHGEDLAQLTTQMSQRSWLGGAGLVFSFVLQLIGIQVPKGTP